jgi:hypothetical protein
MISIRIRSNVVGPNPDAIVYGEGFGTTGRRPIKRGASFFEH